MPTELEIFINNTEYYLNQYPVLLLLLEITAVIVIFVALLFILRSIIQIKNLKGKGFQNVLLLIKVPKERKGEKTENSSSEENIAQTREKIAIAESIFSAIASLRPEKGLKRWLHGQKNNFSFEIVSLDKTISFYTAVPVKYKNFMEQQLHAQYPHAEITEVSDYNLFKPTSHIMGAQMIFKNISALPFNTYKKLDSDPLSVLLNPLSKLEAEEGILIQYIIAPSGPKWRRKAVQIIRDVKEGQKFEYVVRRGKIIRSLYRWKKSLFPKQKDPSKEGMEKSYQLTQMEEDMIKGIEEKISKGGLDFSLRIISSAQSKEKAMANLENSINAFGQYNIYRYGNSFGAVLPSNPHKLIRESIHRLMRENSKSVINTEEMTSFWHMPLSITETPNINWLGARKAPPPSNMPKDGITLGRCLYRGEETIVKMKQDDRRRHLYIVGKSGGGKSALAESMAVQDVLNGEGLCVVDPHGDFVEYVLQHIPKERAEDVIYFNPADVERPIGLNIMEATTEEQKDFITQEMISIFYKLVTDPSMIGPMFEHNMRNVMLTLMSDMENPGTIAEVPRMFTDDEFVEKWKKKIKDPMVLAFWEKEMAKTSDFHKSEMLGYLISKVGRFVENGMIRNIIGQTHSGFNFREVMDKKKILLVNLAKGLVGEINSNLLGMIIVSKLQMVAMERASLPEDERSDFYLYIDEFQNFITDSIATILSEARKYRLDLIIAHQYLNQMVDNKGNKAVRDAVLGNVGTMVSFRIGPEDAEILSKEYAPVFGAYDLINVEKYTAYVKLLIDNTAAKPFNMNTYPPQAGNKELAAAIKELSRLKYGRPKDEVEAEIMERAQLGVASAESAGLNEASL